MRQFLIGLALVGVFGLIQITIAVGMGLCLYVVLYATNGLDSGLFAGSSFKALCFYGYLIHAALTGFLDNAIRYVQRVQNLVKRIIFQRAVDRFGGEEKFNAHLRKLIEPHMDQLEKGEAIVIKMDGDGTNARVSDNTDDKQP